MNYPRLDQAIQWAAQLHSGVERDGDMALPYITHPVEVLINLRVVGGVTDEDALVAAALHDTVEDGATSFEEVQKRFGDRVTALVRELTREEPSPEQTAGMSKDEIWTLRANMLLDEIRQQSPEAQAIKLADRLANVRDAKRTKKGKKLERYLWQSREILKIVPKSVNPGLWTAIELELPK